MLGQQIQKITFGGSKLSSISGESTGVALLKNLSIARRGVINLFNAILYEIYLNLKTFYQHQRHKAQNCGKLEGIHTK